MLASRPSRLEKVITERAGIASIEAFLHVVSGIRFTVSCCRPSSTAFSRTDAFSPASRVVQFANLLMFRSGQSSNMHICHCHYLCQSCTKSCSFQLGTVPSRHMIKTNQEVKAMEWTDRRQSWNVKGDVDATHSTFRHDSDPSRASLRMV